MGNTQSAHNLNQHIFKDSIMSNVHTEFVQKFLESNNLELVVNQVSSRDDGLMESVHPQTHYKFELKFKDSKHEGLTGFYSAGIGIKSIWGHVYGTLPGWKDCVYIPNRADSRSNIELQAELKCRESWSYQMVERLKFMKMDAQELEKFKTGIVVSLIQDLQTADSYVDVDDFLSEFGYIEQGIKEIRRGEKAFEVMNKHAKQIRAIIKSSELERFFDFLNEEAY